MSKQQPIKRIVAAGMSVAIALSAIDPALAAPVLSSTAVVKWALPSDTVSVRSRNRGGAVAAGVAIGVIGALAAGAAARNRGYYYGPAYPPAYGPYYSPYYGSYPSPYYGPGYYGPYPYTYGHYGYRHDNSGAVVAGAMIGAMIGAAAASSQYRRGIRRPPYIYVDPQRVW